MPNYVNNTVIVKGHEKNVADFLKRGLKNSGWKLTLLRNTGIKSLIQFLESDALTREMGKHPGEIDTVHRLTMGTFRPVPDTFLMYDTTNSMLKRDAKAWDKERTSIFNSDEEYEKYVEEFKHAEKLQMRKYGVKGWYDYQCSQHGFGCKWNSEIDSMHVIDNEGDNDIATIVMTIETPWSMPTAWMEWIKRTFDVYVFYCSFEESNMFNCYGEIDSEEADLGDFSDCEGAPKEEDFEGDDDAFYDAVWEWQDEKKQELYNDFLEFVEHYDID